MSYNRLIYVVIFSFGLVNVHHFMAFSKSKAAEIKIPSNLKEFVRLKPHKREFIKKIYPHVLDVNQQITEHRKQLGILKSAHFAKKKLTPAEQRWLNTVLRTYRFKNFQIERVQSWDELLRRVDIVPASLALSMGACESGWGSSWFAKKAKNFFGEWCFKKDCGVVPRKRRPGLKHEVRKFDSIHDSVKAYVLNLNTHAAYRKFRAKRAELRQTGKQLRGRLLADELKHYSERGLKYVKDIKVLIQTNKFDRFPSMPESV